MGLFSNTNCETRRKDVGASLRHILEATPLYCLATWLGRMLIHACGLNVNAVSNPTYPEAMALTNIYQIARGHTHKCGRRFDTPTYSRSYEVSKTADTQHLVG